MTTKNVTLLPERVEKLDEIELGYGTAIGTIGGPSGGLAGSARAVYLYGCDPNDELVDLFPGTGAVTRAWDSWRNQLRLEVA